MTGGDTDGPHDEQVEVMRSFGLGEDDIEAWTDADLPDPAFIDWLTDRVARRPAGQRARDVYGAEDIHDWARRALLDALDLSAADSLLDIGCGGGLLLRDALATGASATGVDHSQTMVALARERAPGAQVIAGSASDLRFAARTFTAVSMSMVFVFLDDPVAVLREAHRVLRPHGRLAVYTTSPELRGTPAAPEPLASKGHFYDDETLADLARDAGFQDVAVESKDGGQLLTARR